MLIFYLLFFLLQLEYLAQSPVMNQIALKYNFIFHLQFCVATTIHNFKITD